MTKQPADRRLMRLLALILTALWAAVAISIASAYRPGGPIDVVVALACFVPVVIADAGIVWPATGLSRRHRTVLVWIWITAVVFVIPVLYGVASGLVGDGPQSLVPSFEESYAAALALLAMAFFSTVGLVHRRRAVQPLQRHESTLTAGLAVLLTVVVGIAFVFVAVVNDQSLRREEPASSRFGPTDPNVEPPFCDEPIALGRNARILIEAKSSLDNVDRGTALLEGQRSGRDETWGGSWEGPDGNGEAAYVRLGALAWFTDKGDDPGAPGTTWDRVPADPFGMLGARRLTMDGPPHSVANAPRGSIVAEDLGLDIIEGARARHCRTFIDGPRALDTFLPLRWLLADGSVASGEAISRWRGEMDWWVFSDGELGLAAVEVSGSRAETDWDAEGTRVVLEARLEASDRDTPVDLSAPASSGSAPLATPGPTPGATSGITLESDS
jgi:hypothetical protein